MVKIRERYYAFLRAFFKDVPKSLYILFLSLFILYAVLPLFFHNYYSFYWFYHNISYVVLSIVIGVLISYYPLRTYFEHYYRKIRTKKLSTSHLAIVMIKYNILFKSAFYILIHFKKFFSILKDNSIPYVVYVVDDKDELIDIVQNKNVKAVYIFGHGQRHGVKFGNEVWHYCNMPKASHIEFVGQFHCNHYTGKSLYDHLECDGRMVDGVTLCYDVNDYIESREYLQHLKKLFHAHN